MVRHYFYISFILLLSNCNSTEENKTPHPFDTIAKETFEKKKQKVNLYQISWMEGLWVDSTSFPNNIVVEDWKIVNDTIVGKRGTVKGNDTSYAQTSKIFINNDVAVYLLEPEGSSFSSFKMDQFSDNSISFSNVANLAPTAIKYSNNRGSLGLEFTVITQVGERTFQHEFKKIK